MATPRGALRRDLPQRVRDLENQLRRLSATVLAGKVRNLLVSGDVTVTGGGDLRILGDAGQVVFSALDGPVKSDFAQLDTDNLNFTQGTWAQYGFVDVPVPPGFTRAHVHMFVSAGATFSSSTTGGNVGAWPRATGDVNKAGPGLTTGTSGATALSVNSGAAFEMPVALSTSLRLAVWAVRNGAIVANTNNVHLSATVIFLR